MPTILYRGRRIDVDDATEREWNGVCRAQNTLLPATSDGLPLRPFPAGVYNGDPVYAGVWVDWQHDVTRRFIYDLRRRPVADQPTHRQLADRYGFQHPLHPYRAADAWARRVRQAGARGGAPRERNANDYRRWSVRPWSAQQMAATAGSRFRRFGIEVEFYGPNGRSDRSGNDAIARAMRAAGLDTHERWGQWHRAAGVPGWHCTYDSTAAGEIISDILDGSQDSLDEVSAVLRAVRDNGGRANAQQGMHVNHDMTDFTLADKVRLVDNLAACQDALLAYIGGRVHSGWCTPMTPSMFAHVRSTVAAGRAPGNDHNVAWNLGHIFEGATCRVEFRGLGHTLNGRKVRAWVRVGQAFMQATKAGHTFAAGTTTSDMLATLRQHGLSTWASDTFAARCGLVPA